VFVRQPQPTGGIALRWHLCARDAAGGAGARGADRPGTPRMIIRVIASSRSVEIDDPGDFKAFSVRIEGAMDAAVQAKLLGSVAVRSDREHAWISEKVLRDWPSLRYEAWWQDGLS